MQEWSNTIDAWIAGERYAPTILPPGTPMLELDPRL
jgi:hypothetical protein